MKVIFILLFATLSVEAAAQLSQKEWLIGGNGLFSYSKSKNLRFTSYQINPAAGYFFKNKLAGGLRMGFNSDTYKYRYDDKFRFSNISAAPFLRYYFLPIDGKLNFFADGAFGYTWSKYRSFKHAATQRYHFYHASLMAGPAIFLNKRTALEVIAGYTYLSRGPIDTVATSKLQLGFGLQVHIGKQ